MAEANSDPAVERDVQPTRLSADPVARSMWKLLEGRPAEDRLLVLEAVRAAEATVRAAKPSRQTLCLRAIERYESECFEPLSKRHYDAWRSRHPEKTSIPSSQYLVNSFEGRSWSAAMEALDRSVTPDHLARRLQRLLPAPTDDEALDALRRCARELDVAHIVFCDYRAWALRQYAAGHREPTLLTSNGAFIRRFGSWRMAQHMAGLDALNAFMGPRSARMPTSELLEHLRAAAAALEDPTLTTHAYARWRASELERALAAGKLRAIPCHATIVARFNGWRPALAAAELITAAQAAWSPRGQGKEATPEHVCWSICQAVREVGPRMTQVRYAGWAQTFHADPDRPTPVSVQILRRFFGSFSRARELAVHAVVAGAGEADLLRHLDVPQATDAA